MDIAGVLSGADVLVLEARGASRGNIVPKPQSGFPQLALRAFKQAGLGAEKPHHQNVRPRDTTGLQHAENEVIVLAG